MAAGTKPAKQAKPRPNKKIKNAKKIFPAKKNRLTKNKAIQNKKTPTGKIDYFFFSKSGFSTQCKKYAQQINAELIDLKRPSQLLEN